MYIDANDVKLYMNLDIHKQVSDFINKEVQESQKMYLEDLINRLQGLLEPEVLGEEAQIISDVGIGIERAIKEVEELLREFDEFDIKNDIRWVPCITEKYPKNGKYVLLSFANFSVPLVGRYEEDEDGGAFYIGDEAESCISQDMIVNAWMPLPKCYKE